MILRAEKDMAVLCAFIDATEKEMGASGGQNLEAVQYYGKLVKNHALMFVQDPNIMASVNFDLRKDASGKETLGISMRANLELFEQLLEKAKTDDFYKRILTAIIIKEGATIRDAFSNVAKHVDIYKRVAALSSANPDDESLKKLAAQLTDSETIGYIAALRYYDENGITPAEVEKHGEKETSNIVGAALRGIYELMVPLTGKNEKERTFLVRESAYVKDIAGIFPKLTQKVMEIGVREGKVKKDPLTGRYSGTKDALSFLEDPKYLQSK